jgi:hypothetical protein
MNRYELEEALDAIAIYDDRVRELQRLRDVEGIDFDDARLDELATLQDHMYKHEVDSVRTNYSRRASTTLEKRAGRSDMTTLVNRAIIYGTRYGCSYDEAVAALTRPAGPVVRTKYGRSEPPPPPTRPAPVAPGWPDRDTLALRARALAYAQLNSCSFDDALKKVAAGGA